MKTINNIEEIREKRELLWQKIDIYENKIKEIIIKIEVLIEEIKGNNPYINKEINFYELNILSKKALKYKVKRENLFKQIIFLKEHFGIDIFGLTEKNENYEQTGFKE